MNRPSGLRRIEGLMNKWRQPQSSFVSQNVSTDNIKDTDISRDQSLQFQLQIPMNKDEEMNAKSTAFDLRHVIELTKKEIKTIQEDIESMSRYSEDIDKEHTRMNNNLSHSQLLRQNLSLSLSSTVERTKQLTQDVGTSTENAQVKPRIHEKA